MCEEMEEIQRLKEEKRLLIYRASLTCSTDLNWLVEVTK